MTTTKPLIANASPKTRRRRHPEDDLQRAVVKLLRASRGARPWVLFFAVPNGGRRSPVEAARLVGLGVEAGVPDIVVIVAGKTYGLELKSGRGKQTPAQIAMANRWRSAGCVYAVASSLEETCALLAQWGAVSKTVVTNGK